MAQPDWVAIFTLRPDLDPPGYAETVIDMAEHPHERPARGKSASSSRPNRFPSLKHGAD
ncbi:hypothetical protein [Vulcanococcus sp.]|uniref:hypothetical protein n=1 Tax=Vulcanococcus sp. TaxID=2856995 RepID=UPI003F69B5F8